VQVTPSRVSVGDTIQIFGQDFVNPTYGQLMTHFDGQFIDDTRQTSHYVADIPLTFRNPGLADSSLARTSCSPQVASTSVSSPVPLRLKIRLLFRVRTPDRQHWNQPVCQLPLKSALYHSRQSTSYSRRPLRCDHYPLQLSRKVIFCSALAPLVLAPRLWLIP